jgi:anti-sigma regulatory factor (Ser/Thr protein kinase)
MPRHVLFVEEFATAPVEPALPAGWRITRVQEAQLALSWLQHTPPDLILVGARPADISPGDFVRTVKLDHSTNPLPLVRIGTDCVEELRVEPDAWLDPGEPHVLSAVSQALVARSERLRDGVRADLRLVLPSDLDHLEGMVELIGPWFAGCGLSVQLRQQLTLCVRELVANSIEWGHQHDRSQPVWVHARLDHEKISVFVRDNGPGFDPCDLPHAASPGDPLSHMAVRSQLQLREGGFGILMTRGMVDHLCYNEAGNEAHLVKYLPSRLQQHAGRVSQGERAGLRP